MKEKRDIFDRIMSLPGLRILQPFYEKHREVLLYLFFGGLTTFVGVGSYALFVYMGYSPLIANVISWFLAVLFAYVTNSIWVFESRAQDLKARTRQMLEFYGGRVLTLVMEEVIILVFVEMLHRNAYLVKIVAQVLVLIGNYLISKLWVFRK